MPSTPLYSSSSNSSLRLSPTNLHSPPSVARGKGGTSATNARMSEREFEEDSANEPRKSLSLHSLKTLASRSKGAVLASRASFCLRQSLFFVWSGFVLVLFILFCFYWFSALSRAAVEVFRQALCSRRTASTLCPR